MKYRSLLCFFLFAAFIASCGITTDLRQQAANHIARPAFMTERFINSNQFQLKTWERMHQRGGPAIVYIEGDSYILSVTGEPTPYHPIGLELAAKDGSENVAYLARPCQFIKFPEAKNCDHEYWRSEIYTEEIINAYEMAINNMIAVYGLTDIHLVGYDGGANIAAILTARNKNVASLRTVAGNLNPALVDGDSLSDESIFAIDYGTKLANVPQIHFIGELDEYTTPKVYHSYRQAVGLSQCVNFTIVPDTGHTQGWIEKWPSLLTEFMPYCEETYKEIEWSEPPPLMLPAPEVPPMLPPEPEEEIPTTLYEDLIK